MEIKLEIPKYDPVKGIKYNWVNGFEIEIKNQTGSNVLPNLAK